MNAGHTLFTRPSGAARRHKKADMKAVRFIACLAALVAAGCSNNNSSTTAPTDSTSVSTFSLLYTDTLPVRGTLTSSSFSVVVAGTATLGLVSVTATPTGPALPAVNVGIGLTSATTNADGTITCGDTISSTTVTPALTSQLSATLAVGTYCVSAFDPGTLTAPVTFVIRIVHT